MPPPPTGQGLDQLGGDRREEVGGSEAGWGDEGLDTVEVACGDPGGYGAAEGLPEDRE